MEEKQKVDIVQILRDYLQDLSNLIKPLTTEEYVQTQCKGQLMQGSVGGHVRHLLSHIQVLMDTFFSAEVDEKIICYDNRQRGTSIETNPQSAVQAIDELCYQLQLVHPKMYQTSVQINHIINANTGQSLTVNSNLQRELLFTFHHLIHHFAMISIRMRLMNKSVPKNFGYAPATVSSNNA